MITIDYALTSDITFNVAHSETKVIKISGLCSSCVLSTKIDAGAQYSIRSSVNSTEFIELPATTLSDLTLENIKIDGVGYASLTFAIPSLYFHAPNLLVIENTSITENIQVSIRGNR